MKHISNQLFLACYIVLSPLAAFSQVLTNPPSVTTQPASQTVACHGTATFSVVASGTGPLSYLWTANGLPLGFPATNATLTLTNVLFQSGTQFRVVVTNQVGAVASDPAILTVTPPPLPGLSIATTGVTNVVGWPHSCAPFTLRSSLYLSGFMTNWVTVGAPFFATDDSNYVSVASSGIDFFQLQTIFPIITSQPTSQTASIGSSVTFSVTATNPPGNTPHPLQYYWHLNGIELTNQTNSTLTLSDIQRQNGGSYTVVVANDLDAVVSQIATLKIEAPEISLTNNFADRVVVTEATNTVNGSNVGANKELFEPNHAGLLGGKSVWLGWKAPSSGIATFDTEGSAFDTILAVYTNTVISKLVPIASDDDSGGFYTSRVQFNAVAGQEYEIAIDGYAGDSGNISLQWSLEVTTNQIPQITFQPKSQTVLLSNSVSFVVGTAPSPLPLSYQWKFNGTNITNNQSATSSNLVISSAQTNSIGSYSVLVSNPARSVESLAALLQLQTRSDTNVSADTELQLIDKIAIQSVPQTAVQILNFDDSGSHQLIVSLPSGGSTTLASPNGGLSQGGDSVTCGRHAPGTLYAYVCTQSSGTLNISASGANFVEVQMPNGAWTPCPSYTTSVSVQVKAGYCYLILIGTSGPSSPVTLFVSLG